MYREKHDDLTGFLKRNSKLKKALKVGVVMEGIPYAVKKLTSISSLTQEKDGCRLEQGPVNTMD